MLEPRIVDNESHLVGVALGELRPVAVAFGVVMSAVALVTVKVFVQYTTVGGNRPRFSHGSAFVAFEAQSASLEVDF